MEIREIKYPCSLMIGDIILINEDGLNVGKIVNFILKDGYPSAMINCVGLDSRSIRDFNIRLKDLVMPIYKLVILK